MNNRIIVLNDPVNFVDPLGLYDIRAGISSADKFNEATDNLNKGHRLKEKEWGIYGDILNGKLSDPDEINKRLKETTTACSKERKKFSKKGIEATFKAGEAIYSPGVKPKMKFPKK